MTKKALPARPAVSKLFVASMIATAIIAGLIAAVGDGWNPLRTPPPGPRITVYRDPPCLCCIGWIDYLRSKGFDVQERITNDLRGTRWRFGVPESLASCHTALVDDYVIEGHVSAEDIERLLRERPAVRGLAVPGMPGTSPGMEPYSTDKTPYEVLTFGAQGALGTFSHHPPHRPQTGRLSSSLAPACPVAGRWPSFMPSGGSAVRSPRSCGTPPTQQRATT